MTQLLNAFANSTLVDILHYRAIHQSDSSAFIFLQDGETQGVSITYKELDKQAQGIASSLESLNASGERALLLYPPGLEFIAAFLGCLYAKVVAVPAYPPRRNQKINRLQAIVKDAEATLCLTTASELDNIRNKFIQDSQLASLGCLATDSLIDNNLLDWQKPIIDKDTLAFLQYTSGSTGTPKGVMVSHGNLLSNCADLDRGWIHKPGSVIVTWLPTFHDMGLIYGVLQPIYKGISCYMMAPVSFLQRPIRWLEIMSRYKATHSGAPNFAYELCASKVTAQELATLDLSNWRMALNGAEPLRAEVLKRFAKIFKPCGFELANFCPGYGLAEATLKVTAVRQKDTPTFYRVQAEELRRNKVIEASKEQVSAKTLVGCGRTEIDTKIVIVNPESLTTCTHNEIGEIWVSGSTVAQGYWGRTEETQKTFQAYLSDTNEGPFLRTGDLGFLRDGELFVTGRIKDVIIIRGCNHYPQDIELTVEKSHPALRITCSAAFTVEVDGEERLVIAQEVERVYLRKLKVDEVVGAIRKAVSEHHQLQVYGVLLLRTGSIPKTSSGKIQRHACKIGFVENNLQVVGSWMSQSSTIQSQSDNNSADSIQKWIKQWLSGKLQISSNLIDTQKSFAEYGLDSVMAVELAQDLKSKFNPERELEATIAWNFPNIDSLVQYMGEPIDASSIAASNFNSSNLIATSSQKLKQVSEDEVKTAISQEVAQIENLLAELESLQRSN